MRILLVAGSYPPETGGIAEFMRAFAEGLVARGIGVEVMANPRLPSRGYLKRIQTCRKEVLEQLHAAAFDRVVLSSWSPYAVGLPKKIGDSKLPFDVFCHGMDILEPSRSLPYRMLMRRTLRRASRVLANSRYTASLAKTFGARRDRVQVLHPGVDCQRFRPGPRVAGGRTILSVGRLVERKGFDLILRSLPHVLKRFPDVHYRCAGDGEDRERLLRLASELNISASVEWLGEVSEREKVELYQSADVFVMPNRIDIVDGSVEGFGIVFLEAAACGLPVVAGDSGGAPDAVEHEKTGYLVNPESLTNLSGRLIELLGDRDLALRMGQAARQRVLSNFREDQIAERYLAQL